jgi:hypothetical protein
VILASSYYMFKTYGRSKTDNKNLEEKLLWEYLRVILNLSKFNR